MTIYLTRNEGWFWHHPWPSWRLFAATETTQVLGTLAAVYGWFVEPIGWGYALMISAYALVWLIINNLAKVLIYRAMRNGLSQRHLHRVQSSAAKNVQAR